MRVTNSLTPKTYKHLPKVQLARFLDLTGHDPLVLVAGCGGNERRLIDIAKRVAKAHNKAGKIAIIWIEFGREKNDCRLPESITSLPGTARIVVRDLGGLLSETYLRITSRFPGALAPYKATCERLVSAVSNRTQPLDNSAVAFDEARGRKLIDDVLVNGVLPKVTFIDNSTAVDESELLDSPNQWAIFSWIRRLPSSKTLVYIDLESHHSLADVVNAIFEQARISDTALLPVLMPVGAGRARNNTKIHRQSDSNASNTILGTSGVESLDTVEICKRVLQALERNEIGLVLDGLDAFEWKPLNHHGVS